ncbi:interferon- double-stranded RNA-activated kinase-like protein [Labeo rohita]|uniref:Interferon-double-stranded RNA-activated kinase-like protein n=1 Tax=Labeo rohita TaxID=84645 RepID=A0A498LLT1_LABRO|nr:interferon- double-stranded RNA-activated kinase-like protein [Labeo rohita]
MSADTEVETKICNFLRRNGKSKAFVISKQCGLDKRIVNKHLYSLEKSNQLFKCTEQPPIWDLVENMNKLKLTPEPKQKSQTTTETSGEKDVEKLLTRSGGLKAYEIAKNLGQSRQSINKQLYSMEEKGKVKKCSQSKLWRLNDEWSDESFSQESSSSCPSDHGLDSVPGLSNSFDVIAKLGEGGFGWVYKVKHKIDEKIYAVKRVILTRSASAAEPPENNRIDGLDSNQSRTCLFIQMEFCEGGTLTNWIKARNFMEKQRTIVEIHKIFYEIITGVEYIHANELIHRDLKPDNILFGADGKVKIGDFGLVAAQTDQNGDPMERSNRGTPTYMSPEQKNKKHYDEKTDIFPLGLVWFEMIWKISTLSERMKLWTDLRDRRFPEGFSDSYRTESKFIMKMLSYSPEHRPHAKDIKEKLEKFFSLHQNLLSQKTV